MPHQNPSSPLRAALYARYSNADLQRETSIDDQLRAARARVASEGWIIVAEHGDEGISGTVPVAMRKGGKALLADALASRFDLLVMEGLDRLSRDSLEQEKIVRLLEHRGVRLVGISDGYDSLSKSRTLVRGVRGLINSIYLQDLAEKTHRGLAGQFDRGYHVGGVCFGYRSQPTADGKGRELVIDEAQAAIVRRIFEDYADGSTARGIAHRLNAEGVPSPRGGTWAVSAFVGDRKRGAGLLNSEIYIGRLVWNRRQWLKEPETGKRRYVDRPQSEWQVREVPELRIIDAELWATVRARDQRVPGRGAHGGPMRTLFAGLLRCSVCGGPMTAIDARRYGCHARNDRGEAVCVGGGAFPRAEVERTLLSVVREDLMAPDVLAAVQGAVKSALRQAAAEQAAPTNSAARKVELRAEIDRLVDAIVQIGLSDALRQRLATAEGELASLAAASAPRPRLDPDRVAQQAVATYKRRLLDLEAALQQDSMDRGRTRALLADILGPVVLRRDAEGEWAEMEEPAQRVALAGSTLLTVVARARNVRRKLIRAA